MENERRADYSQRDVMGLVIDRLYRGTSPDRKTIALNGRILNWLVKRGYDWEACARIVEGLALRRDRGKLLPTVQTNEPVSLCWVWAKAMDINQVALCEDAFYASQPKPAVPIKGGKPTSIMDILKKAV